MQAPSPMHTATEKEINKSRRKAKIQLNTVLLNTPNLKGKERKFIK